MNLHWDGYGKDHKSAGTKTTIPTLTEGFHDYGLLWTKEEYVFYVDGKEVWRSIAGGVSQVPEYLKLTEEIRDSPSQCAPFLVCYWSFEMAGLALDKRIEKIAFSWWNVGLAPAGRSNGNTERQTAAKAIVKHLIDDLDVGVLALGEVTSQDLVTFKDACNKSTLAIFDGTLKDGRLQFDTGIIFDRARLEILDHLSLIDAHGHRRLKLANQVSFMIATDKTILHVFVTHWPSRGVTEENIPARKRLAVTLGQKWSDLRLVIDHPAIVVLGDFNDEPFDEAMVTFLRATRDRTLASSGEHLYNPFWRHLGEMMPYASQSSDVGCCGTFFHAKGIETKWRTFDQILFSSAFLGNGDWHLDERQTLIFASSPLLELNARDSAFDHFPVLSTIEKMVEGE